MVAFRMFLLSMSIIVSGLCMTNTVYAKSRHAYNYSTIKGPSVIIKAHVFRHDTALTATKNVDISCDYLSGSGLIKAPYIRIVAKRCSFRGTIDCSHECVIITEHPFNHKKFKKKGHGTFKFQVDPHAK